MKYKLSVIFLIVIIQSLIINLYIYSDAYESKILGLWCIDKEQFYNNLIEDDVNQSQFEDKLFLEWFDFWLIEFSENEITFFLLPQIESETIYSIEQQDNLTIIETDNGTIAIDIIDDFHINLITKYDKNNADSNLIPLMRDVNSITDQDQLTNIYENKLSGKWVFNEELFQNSGFVESFSNYYLETSPELLQQNLSKLDALYSSVSVMFFDSTVIMNFDMGYNGLSQETYIIPIFSSGDMIVLRNIDVRFEALYPYIIAVFKDDNSIHLTLGFEFTRDNNIFVLYLEKENE